MTPPNFGAPCQYIRGTPQVERSKESMRDPKNVVDLEDVITSKTSSIIPTRVEEEKSIALQGEVG